MLVRLLFAVFSTVAVVVTVPGIAQAHPLVDEARAKYEAADFEGALDALTRAESAAALTRGDLVAIYELRALVHLGMGDEDAVGRDLRRLLTIAPGHELSDGAPPEVLRRASQVRDALGGPIRMTLVANADPSGVSISADVDRDPEGLVRQLRIVSRRGEQDWRITRGSSVTLPGGESIAYYGEAVGPGGVVLASDGSPEEPRTWDARGGEGPPWLWIGVGAGAAVVAALIIVIVAVAASGGSDQTRPTLPMVSF